MKPLRKLTTAPGTEKVKDVVAPAPEQRTFDDARPYDAAFFDRGMLAPTSSNKQLEAKAEAAEIAKISEGSQDKIWQMIDEQLKWDAMTRFGKGKLERWDWDDRPRRERKVTEKGHQILFFGEITIGENWERLDIQGNELLAGVFANANIPQKELTGHREISAPRVDLIKDRVKITMLDGIQDNQEDLKEFKEALAESNKTHSYDPIRESGIGMSEIQVNLDLADKTLKSSSGTSYEWRYLGNKCFLLRGNIIFDFSNTDKEQLLKSGDVIFVASNNILNRLLEENIGANSSVATPVYREAALTSEIRTLLYGAKNKDGKLEQDKLAGKLSDIYFESGTMRQNGTIAAAYVAYQIP